MIKLPKVLWVPSMDTRKIANAICRPADSTTYYFT